ncbi:transcription elongation factor GreA [Cohnella lubricantis]|uniref:Transcription elongation factor GreA n=1 Tax=Cohnella lubricantis TaxID=2163172 RepID=A0A841TD12_9BACL|nr:transcription elongation factor GreA [Cohnella lubricantis]MBB6677889.1 transcription elongation factor GreA [Cohnella lubricantis]MBP2119072.1 transcription elongation factor GreA [Cohnella lubricantis]
MANDEVILTPEGKLQLEKELEELKTVGRKEMSERIKLALSYGDLKENFEYHAAKNDQGFMETRIQTIEKTLKRARIVESNDSSKVQIGSTVVLNDIEMNEKLEYRIVGGAEANVLENKISYESPLGAALMGKSVGDKINVEAPMGVIQYELLEIRIGE